MRWDTYFIILVIAVWGYLIVTELEEMNRTLNSIDSALYEQILYMTDDYIEEFDEEIEAY